MLSKVSIAGVAVAAGLSVAATASAVVVTNTSVADRPTLLSGFTELNLATYAANSGFAGLSGASSNTYTDTYELAVSPAPGAPLSYSGSLTAEVFGNVSTTGTALTDVVIVYTFQSNGYDGTDNITGSETFAMGINTGWEVDYNYLVDPGTTHGSISSESAAGQASLVELFDNVSANDTYEFDYINAVGGSALGGSDGDETYTWYIHGSAGTKINIVDVTVTDTGNTTTTTLGFVTNPGQPDLDVPAPGVLALAGLGFGAMGARRRRA